MDNEAQSEIVSSNKNSPSELKTNIPLLIVISVLFLAGVVGLTYTGSRKENVQDLKAPKIEKLVFAKPQIPLKKYSPSLQSGPFSCPTIDSVCKNGTYKDNSLAGNVPPGSNIYAAFDGKIQGLLSYHPNTDKTQEEYYFLILTNKEKGLRAFYSIKAVKGQVTANKDVKAGDKIATSNGVVIKYKDNKSFIFEMAKMTQKGAERINLSKSDFK